MVEDDVFLQQGSAEKRIQKIVMIDRKKTMLQHVKMVPITAEIMNEAHSMFHFVV